MTQFSKVIIIAYRQQLRGVIALVGSVKANRLIVVNLDFIEYTVLHEACHHGPLDFAEELAGVLLLLGGEDVTVIVDYVARGALVAAALVTVLLVVANRRDVLEQSLQRRVLELEANDGCWCLAISLV